MGIGYRSVFKDFGVKGLGSMYLTYFESLINVNRVRFTLIESCLFLTNTNSTKLIASAAPAVTYEEEWATYAVAVDEPFHSTVRIVEASFVAWLDMPYRFRELSISVCLLAETLQNQTGSLDNVLHARNGVS